MSLLVDRILARQSTDPAPLVSLFAMLSASSHGDPQAARKCLETIAAKVQSNEISGIRLAALRPRLQPVLAQILSGPADGPLYLDAALLATTWQDQAGILAVRKLLLSSTQPESRRLQAIDALIAAEDNSLLDAVGGMLADAKSGSAAFRGAALASLGRLEDDRVAEIVLAHYAKLEVDVQPKAIELLTQRTAWTGRLLTAIERKQLPTTALNVNQVRKILASKDPELTKRVTATWGTLRTDRNPQREQVIAQVRSYLRENPGDPHGGLAVYKKVCGQCHKIYGEGQEVGPDITVNGRSSYEQLLSNVLDPSLVIGASYQARTVATTDGRILTGLLVEDSPQRVVLKIQGGKLETVARDDIGEMEVSKLSMMPEDLEKQLKPQELADLFAFLILDRPPSDPQARKLPMGEPGSETGNKRN
jgi:putative heme-binding domain-containing protein